MNLEMNKFEEIDLEENEPEEKEIILKDYEVKIKDEFYITINRKLWLSSFVGITVLSGLNHLLAKRLNSAEDPIDLRFFTMRKETTFNHMKIIYYPWSIYWLICKLYLNNINKQFNMLASALGLLLTISLVAVFFVFYKHLLPHLLDFL